jgi:hypothetical protein
MLHQHPPLDLGMLCRAHCLMRTPPDYAAASYISHHGHGLTQFSTQFSPIQPLAFSTAANFTLCSPVIRTHLLAVSACHGLPLPLVCGALSQVPFVVQQVLVVLVVPRRWGGGPRACAIMCGCELVNQGTHPAVPDACVRDHSRQNGASPAEQPHTFKAARERVRTLALHLAFACN